MRAFVHLGPAAQAVGPPCALAAVLLAAGPASAQALDEADQKTSPPKEARTVVPRLQLRSELAFPERLELLQDQRWPLPELALAMGTLGVASLTAALVLDARAGAGLDAMTTCAPECPAGRVEAVDRTVWRSRMAGSIGVLSLATAAWLALAESPADAFAPRGSGAPRLRLFGGAGGMRALLTTTFDETRLLQGANPLQFR